MAELIDRTAIHHSVDKRKMSERVLDCVDAAPAADVAEVRHGKWAHLGGDDWCCTECYHVITTEGSWEKPIPKYCEECGARMDKEDEHEAD